MHTLPIFQIDAFSSQPFGGNPAAIVPLDRWLADEQLQAIAAENNLSETAFLVAEPDCDFHLRWFTPTKEVELCGHATLASAWYLFELAGFTRDCIRFRTRSGLLEAWRADQGIRINLPTRASQPAPELTAVIEQALGTAPLEVWRGANAIAFFADAETIQGLQPDFHTLKQLHPCGLIVTAPGQNCDFVSRYFAPSFGIDEDPVTGSAHADLMPLWTRKLGRAQLQARQLSARGGTLLLQQQGERLDLTGQCVLYLRGEILI